MWFVPLSVFKGISESDPRRSWAGRSYLSSALSLRSAGTGGKAARSEETSRSPRDEPQREDLYQPGESEGAQDGEGPLGAARSAETGGFRQNERLLAHISHPLKYRNYLQ